MKKVAAILFVSALTTAGFSQGLVSFANGPTTEIRLGGVHSVLDSGLIPSNDAGGFCFGLLTSPSATGPFGFSGLYATNSATAGRIAAYTTSVSGWAPGAARFYEVAGWSASLGQAFDPNWLTGNFRAPGFFGVSAIATGTAGGGSPVPAPAWNLFGGTGLTGFNLDPINLVPEPSSFALGCLGASVLVLRRRKLMN
jgi:hypothetical protein